VRQPAAPQRARRPADRRDRIIAAAGDLFCESGYHNVSLAQVAAAVGITAPSVYRHFENKQDLLLQVVAGRLDGHCRLTAGAATLDDFLRASAAGSVENRNSATLWQREARHLPQSDRADMRRALVRTARGIGQLISNERPDTADGDAELLAWAVMSVFGSVSRHRTSLPRRRFEQLLVELGSAAAHAPLGRTGAVDEPAADRDPASVLAPTSRERLLTEAIRLFDRRGFQSVSTDEIGEAAGMTGPNIYKHFPAKTDLLVAAVHRGGDRRNAVTSDALRGPGEISERLDRLVDSYVEFAHEQSHLLGVLVSELDQLPEHERRAAQQAQREYVALWVGLLQQARPGLDQAAARITVSAALTTVEDLVRTGPLLERPDLPDRLAEICRAILKGTRP
jgi:AcrR family transcriptional regulator